MADEPDELTVPPTDYSADGVDLTLIRWMLSLTPDERLESLQGSADSMWELTNGLHNTLEERNKSHDKRG